MISILFFDVRLGPCDIQKVSVDYGINFMKLKYRSQTMVKLNRTLACSTEIKEDIF